jgi:hypothetical protein
MEQDALYSQGRESLEIVNQKRKGCNLWVITEAENKRPVTWTMRSKHIVTFDPNSGEMVGRSRAFDFAIVRDKQFIWEPKIDVNDNDIPDYEEVGIIAEKLGLIWGGRWKSPDRPHIEIA